MVSNVKKEREQRKGMAVLHMNTYARKKKKKQKDSLKPEKVTKKSLRDLK